MPLPSQISKYKHPNSRKTSALSKQITRDANKLKRKSQRGGTIEKRIILDRMQWFKNNLDTSLEQYTVEAVIALIVKYLERFNEELEQIQIKRSIGNRVLSRQHQHANREDMITMTIDREKEQFNTCGLEVPDIQIVQQLQLLKNWSGELNLLPLFKMKRIKNNLS